MTSKKSFWANCRENHKRRIWVWIVSVLGQLAVYVGILIVYLSRIRSWYAEGRYRTYEEYHEVLCRATAESLGFQGIFLATVTGLAAIIGIQGFSYLHDRKKVDLYHSVPVDKDRRFFAVYLNGIIIYLTSTVISITLGLIVAAVQKAVNGPALSEVGFAFIWNLLFFLVIYHTVILAVMLTGNRLITICIAGVFMLYEPILYELNEAMQYAFFDTVSTYFVRHVPKVSAVYDYFSTVYDLRYAAWNEGVGGLAEEVLPYYCKWLILALVILAAAWFCYRKRPSEAAGKAIAFAKAEPVLKVLIAVPVSVGVGMIIHEASYESTPLTVVSMIISGVIVCAAAEVIYDFDIKSLLKHPISGGVAVLGIVAVFVIYNYDLLGYDKYVPLESKVDSVALTLGSYDEFWAEDFTYLNASQYAKEHMFITDVEPVLTLASKWQQEYEHSGDMAFANTASDFRAVSIMYRLKSGREVGRLFYVDFANPANEELLDRIVGSEEYKDGAYQIMMDRDSFDQVQIISYSNGATGVALPPEDAQTLRDAYVKDMEKFDFSLAVHERPCGRVDILFPNYRRVHLDVYESFENTIAYLQSKEAYYPVQLNPDDIEDITVVNYHYELREENNGGATTDYGYSAVPTASVVYGDGRYYGDTTTVRTTFYDREQFAQIVSVIHPSNMSTVWHNDSREVDTGYEVYVTFKRDTTYPYSRDELGVWYRFYMGQVPEFVKEATAKK